MQHCEPLFWFGLFVLCVTGGLIVVPYLRGRAELLSAWNMLLLGVGLFMGFGSMEGALSPIRFRGLDWFEPTQAEVVRYLLFSAVFLITLILIYYFEPTSKAISARAFNKWPPITTGLLFLVMSGCLALAVVTQIPFLLRVPFVSAVVVNVSHKAFVFAGVFSFILWLRHPRNMIWLATFVVMFMITALLAIIAGGGRRMLLSVVFGPVLVFYYYQARTWKPTKCLMAIGVATVVIGIVGAVYATFRHFDRRGEKSERTAAAVVERVASANISGALQHFASDILFQLAQQNVHYAMLIDQFVATGKADGKPFNTFAFLASYPIPRAIWSGKPQTLGRSVGTDIIPEFARNTGIRWGCGVAGQAAYEGGLIVVPFFAYLAVVCVRLFDDPLRRQPTNPFLLAMLSAGSFHLLAWPRGDLGVMSVEVIECFFFTFALGLGCRFLFGVERNPTRAPYIPNASHFAVPLRR